MSELLLDAAESGNCAKIRSLVNFGANINYTDSRGGCALLYALNRNHYDAADLLIDLGANVKMMTTVGNMMKFAIIFGDERIVKKMIIKGASVNGNIAGFEEKVLYSPLTKAVHNNKPIIVKLLLDNGADLFENGVCYCYKAAQNYGYSHNEVKTILKQAGAR